MWLRDSTTWEEVASGQSFSVPGTYKVCVELVASTLTAEALVSYEFSPALGVTPRELRLHDLGYPVVLIPNWALEGLVATREMTWVHKNPGPHWNVLPQRRGTFNDFL